MTKTTNRLIEEGRKLKTFRKLMKLKQIDVAAMFETEQGNYSRMEAGRLNSGYRLKSLGAIFIAWRSREIERLKKHIEFLESL